MSSKNKLRKMWLISLVLGASILLGGVALAMSSNDDLLRKYEANYKQFEKAEIGDMIVYFQQRMIDDAIVEKDFIVYQFGENTKSLLKKITNWRTDLPEHLPQMTVTKEQAESMVKGEIRSTNLYIISPESDVFPIKPTPQNPCWTVRSVNNGNMIVTIIDAVNGEMLGHGVPPPYTGFSMAGPSNQEECSGTHWNKWRDDGAYWFNEMGYSTQKATWPSKTTIKSQIQSTTIAMFYELAHGGYNLFANNCSEWTRASDISTWMGDGGGGGGDGPQGRKATYTKMPFAFIGSCGGMTKISSGSFSHAFRKGSTEKTTTVGYWFYDFYGGAYHVRSCMDNAWSNSLNWQKKMFSYMKSGYSVKSAFDKAVADYPMCNGCVRFAGDPTFAVVPVVKRAPDNYPPTASISANPTSGKAPLTVSFTGSGQDADGTIASYKWNFGDGSKGGPAGRGGGGGGGEDEQTTHTYNNAGTYKATLTVTDNDGATGSASVTITVTSPGENQPPTASISANPTSGKAPLTVSFTGSGKDSDGTIASYKWNFGDGSKGGGPAGRPDDGDGGGDGGGGDAQTTHTYNNPGTYKATLTVTDDDGATGSASVTITVTGSGGGGGWVTPIAAEASSYYNSSYVPGKAIDNNTGTYWSSKYADGPPFWIKFDMGATETISKVRVMMPQKNLPTTLDVQAYVYSSSGGGGGGGGPAGRGGSGGWSWKTLVSGFTITSGGTFIEISFAQTNARYIRLWETAVPLDRLYGSCTEVDVYVAGYKIYGADNVTTTVNEVKDLPTAFKLSQNHPNPFVKLTTICYQLPRESKVSLKIYDVGGKLVKTLVNEEKGAGCYKVSWSPELDRDTKRLESGIYFAKLVADDYKSTKKLILMR